MRAGSVFLRAVGVGLALVLSAACSAPDRESLVGSGKRSRRSADDETTTSGAAASDAGSGSLGNAPRSPSPPLDSPGTTVDAGSVGTGTGTGTPDAGTGGTTTPTACTAVCAGALGTCGCRLAGVRTMACQGDQCACLESGGILPTNVFTAAGACDSREEMLAVFTANCGCP